MKTCTDCGTQLPPNARFCGNCGHVQEATSYTSVETRRNDTPPPPSWSYYNRAAPGNPATPFPPPPTGREQREERKDIPPWLSQYGAGIGLAGGQAFPPGAPSVAGTPQISGAPSVAGTPPVPSGSFHPGQLAQGAAPSAPPQAPYYPGVQGGNSSYPAANQPPPHTYPQQQPTQWGTQEPHAYHGRGEAHGLHHPEQHLQHAAPAHAAATKVAGGIATKWILVAVAAVVVLGGGGAALAAYVANRTPPLQPAISITTSPGNYKVGNTLAGASGTLLHIKGSMFSNNSTITFLLDGTPAPGSTGAKSDANGNFQADLHITDGWSVGTHTLTARDTNNNSTQNGVTVMIVSPGQGSTPGPLGAPPDDASFKVIAQIRGQGTAGNQFTAQETEVVTGHPDPMGGTVCQPEDNGQPIVTTGFTSDSQHIPYRDTSTFSCTGSYKGGKLTLTETITSEVFVFSQPDGTTATCTLNSPQTNEQVSGSYTGNNTFSGTISYPVIADGNYPCNGSRGTYYNFHPGGQGNWTGQVTDLHS